MMLQRLVSDQGRNAMVGMIGTGSTSSAANPAVEAFKTTGGTQVLALPRRNLLLDLVVVDRRLGTTNLFLDGLCTCHSYAIISLHHLVCLALGLSSPSVSGRLAMTKVR